jgi:gluconolactonase
MTKTIEIHDDRLNEIVSLDVSIDKVASGFRFLEGPIWHPANHFLIFSDIMGNGLYKWDEAEGVSLFRENSYMANGNTYDRTGQIVTCEHATSRVTRTAKNGEVSVLASHYQGKELNSPNDIVVKKDGAIYFTDPNPGRGPRVGVPREQELSFQGVYRYTDSEGLTLLVDDFSKPNGLCFSLDERYLFINDTDRQHIRRFDVKTDGTLSSGILWADLYGKEPGVADGMKVDQEGNLFCSGPGGIQIFDSEAKLLGRILTPEIAANFAWGDPNLCRLYLAATTTLYRMKMKIPGLPLF